MNTNLYLIIKRLFYPHLRKLLILALIVLTIANILIVKKLKFVNRLINQSQHQLFKNN